MKMHKTVVTKIKIFGRTYKMYEATLNLKQPVPKVDKIKSGYKSVNVNRKG